MSPATSSTYTCPGETHSISRSVHIARLATFYSQCRNCQHRHDVGHLVVELEKTKCLSGQQTSRASLLTEDGVRGVYLNELDRPRASNWSAAFASMLWDEHPRFGRSESSVTEGDSPRESVQQIARDVGVNAIARADIDAQVSPVPTLHPRRGPTVVIGFDERPSSPDIVTGVALGLRRMGCDVVDLGQTTSPCLHFVVHHLDAAGGMLVTGAGCDPAWTGFQFVGRGARPWSMGGTLEELESRVNSQVVRPTRTAGSQRTFQGLPLYSAGLGRFFHALRPLQIVCGSATRLVPRVLDSLFLRLPCQLKHEPLPVRRRDLSDPNDADVRRVASAVVSGRQHLGLIIDDDGQRCAFITDRGRLVLPGELARLLIDFELREHRGAEVLVAEPLANELHPWLSTHGTTCHGAPASAARLTAEMGNRSVGLAVSADHRAWFNGDYPASDAIRTLARVLQALSLSDTTMNDIVTRLSQS